MKKLAKYIVATEYKQFVKKELDAADPEAKKDMGKLMKEIAKKWNAQK